MLVITRILGPKPYSRRVYITRVFVTLGISAILIQTVIGFSYWYGGESSRERKFLGAKVPCNFRSRERKFPGTKVPGSESSTYGILSLLGAKVRGNESSIIRKIDALLYYCKSQPMDKDNPQKGNGLDDVTYFKINSRIIFVRKQWNALVDLTNIGQDPILTVQKNVERRIHIMEHNYCHVHTKYTCM